MDSSKPEKIEVSSFFKVHENDDFLEFSPLIRIYKDGRIERLVGKDVVETGIDPETGVKSKDVVISKEINLSARLFIPKNTSNKKLPLLIYFHGGGFVIESAFSPLYQKHLNLLVSQANIVAVSVNYRLAPEHPLPIAYEDSWCAIKWVASHCSGNGDEVWLNEHVDFGRVFLGGDSAGGNITHNMAMRAGLESPGDVKLEGIILTCPFFWGSDEIVRGKVVTPAARDFFVRLWKYSYPETIGADDPVLNPEKDPNLMKLGCLRVLILAAEKDYMKDREFYYYELLKKSGWKGSVEIMESKGEDHCFCMLDTTSENALALFKKIVCFINQD